MHTVYQRQGILSKRCNLFCDTDNQHDDCNDCKRQIIAPVILHILVKWFLFLEHNQLAEHIVQYQYNDLYKQLGCQFMDSKCITQNRQSKNFHNHGHQTGAYKLHRLYQSCIKSLLLTLKYKKFICKVGIENLDKIFDHFYADMSSKKPPVDYSLIDSLKSKVDEIIDKNENIEKQDLEINGNDMLALKIQQKQISKIKNEIYYF